MYKSFLNVFGAKVIAEEEKKKQEELRAAEQKKQEELKKQKEVQNQNVKPLYTIDVIIEETDLYDFIEEAYALGCFGTVTNIKNVTEVLLKGDVIELVDNIITPGVVYSMKKDDFLEGILKLVKIGTFMLCDGIVDMVYDESTVIEVWEVIIDNK